MAKIVFTWELGEGIGHITPYIPIINALKKKGHEVIFIARDLTKMEGLINNVACFQAPVRMSPIRQPVRVICTYAHILHNIGFDNPIFLKGMVRGWRSLFNMLDPSLVLLDHSPTALLASEGYKFKKIVIGNGFLIPPPSDNPLPNLRSWVKIPSEQLHCDEERTLKIINVVLAQFSLPSLNRVSNLFSSGTHILTTLKELDPYQERNNGNYKGTWVVPFGEAPLWPEGGGKRIFVYLKSFPLLPALLMRLDELKTPVIVYIDGHVKMFKSKFSSRWVRLADKPQNMSEIKKSCDLAVLNGNHNTTLQLLLAGKPALHLPIWLEQHLTANAVEKLGMGINAASLKIDGIIEKLKLMIGSKAFTEEAEKFAGRYSHINTRTHIEEVVNFIES